MILVNKYLAGETDKIHLIKYYLEAITYLNFIWRFENPQTYFRFPCEMLTLRYLPRNPHRLSSRARPSYLPTSI